VVTTRDKVKIVSLRPFLRVVLLVKGLCWGVD